MMPATVSAARCRRAMRSTIMSCLLFERLRSETHAKHILPEQVSAAMIAFQDGRKVFLVCSAPHRTVRPMPSPPSSAQHRCRRPQRRRSTPHKDSAARRSRRPYSATPSVAATPPPMFSPSPRRQCRRGRQCNVALTSRAWRQMLHLRLSLAAPRESHAEETFFTDGALPPCSSGAVSSRLLSFSA